MNVSNVDSRVAVNLALGIYIHGNVIRAVSLIELNGVNKYSAI